MDLRDTRQIIDNVSVQQLYAAVIHRLTICGQSTCCIETIYTAPPVETELSYFAAHPPHSVIIS